MRPLPALLLVVLAAGLFSACQSTQDRSRRLAAEGKGLLAEHGVAVSKRSRDVKVLSTAVLQDANGTAAVVKVRNTSKRALWQLPISIDVTGAGRKSLFRNDQPGLEPTLAHVPLVRPGQTFTWVNDQVAATGRPRGVKATVGEGAAIDPGRIPNVALTRPLLHDDPVSGVAAVGFAVNRSKVDLRKLVIFAVAQRGGRVVAAGKAQIPRLKPGKRAQFQAFFIGNPKGARIELSGPPSRLG
jgi:hypothetical protein